LLEERDNEVPETSVTLNNEDAPIAATDWPLSIVRPPMLVPERSSPAVFRMYDHLVRACPDRSTVVKAGF
jgi:hypothetical protein